MNKRLMGVLIFALVIAGAASLVLYRMLSARMDAARQNGGQVWVATHDLAIGTLVKDTDIRTAEWSGPPPQQSIAKPEDIIGRGVIAAVYTGEPILESRLAARGAGAGMAATIPVGMRATAIRVNEVVGVADSSCPECAWTSSSLGRLQCKPRPPARLQRRCFRTSKCCRPPADTERYGRQAYLGGRRESSGDAGAG